MVISLKTATDLATANQLIVSVPLSVSQLQLLNMLNQFAIHQATNNLEVRRFPAKMLYKVNDELKMALTALLTTCSLLDPHRHGNEVQKFFENEIKIIQKSDGVKTIDFGKIRPQLIQQSLIPELVNDWILYRDINGDGIHALMDNKTYMQGLPEYARGGHPVYEFARFYRTFMKDKLSKRAKEQEKIKELTMQSLIDQTIRQKLEQGYQPQDLLTHVMDNGYSALLSHDESIQDIKSLPKK